MATRLSAACLAVVLLLAGCSEVVNGAGHNVPTAPAPARPTSCPKVEYPSAMLSFDCITTGMRSFYEGSVWPVAERRIVEQATGWVLEEGAGHWGSPAGQSLATIAVTVRQRMVSVGGYGVDPRARTVASRSTTIDGHDAYLLQTTFTLDPHWARTDGTNVEREKLWIVAIEVAPGDVSLWYISVPDLTSELWPRVPAVIASITVG